MEKNFNYSGVPDITDMLNFVKALFASTRGSLLQQVHPPLKIETK